MNSKSTMSTKNGIGPSQIQPTFRQYPQTSSGGGGGHVYFVCTGMSGHTGGKLTYSQTKVDSSISQNTPIARPCTIKHGPKLAKLQWVLLNLQENHPLPGRIIEMMTGVEDLCIKIIIHPQVFNGKFTPIHRFTA